MPATISRYSNIKDVTSTKCIELDMFLDYIKDGHWQDLIYPIRNLKDKDELTAAKAKLPYVCVSGLFTKRTIEGLQKHSGFIAIDLDVKDNPGILDKRDILYTDKYLYSGFVSASGNGLCLIFRIDGGRHLDAFNGLEEYLFTSYDVIADTGCKDITRPRYVSFDPHMFIALGRVDKFTLYPKEKPPKRVEQIVFAKTDFEDLLKEVVDRGINLVDSYHDWMRVAFAFADTFGDAGRNYFHLISSCSSKYNPRQADRQYGHCLRRLGAGAKEATIAVFYYLAKNAGLRIYSEKTKIIVNASIQAKKGGRSREQVASALENFEGITGADDLIEQVFNSNIESIGDDSLIDQVELFLKHNYSLKRNEITRYIEDKGVPLMQCDLNSIFIACKRIYDKISYELLDRIINSDITPTYNALKDYFEGSVTTGEGLIDALADSILSADHLFTRHFFKKWMVSIVGSVYGDHSPLMFILSGPVHGKGKTEFIRRLIPNGLKRYFADISPGMKDTDFHILMTQKLILLDDECGNKAKKEDLALKSLLSKQVMTLREPYGKFNVDLQRLAVFAGTSNENDLISDIDNRRLIPIPYFSHNFEIYNSIDKDAVFAEAYKLYKDGYNYHLTAEDKEWLNKSTSVFQKFTIEYELLIRYFRHPVGTEENLMSATEIKNILEIKSVQKLQGVDKIGRELRRLNYTNEMRKINGSTKRCYNIIEITNQADYTAPDFDAP